MKPLILFICFLNNLEVGIMLKENLVDLFSSSLKNNWSIKVSSASFMQPLLNNNLE